MIINELYEIDSKIFRELRDKKWSDTSDFLITKFMREAYLDKKNDDIKPLMLKIKEEYPLWYNKNGFLSVPWTENHLSGLLSSRVLLALYFDDIDLYHESIDTLDIFLDSRLEFGLSEIASQPYLTYFVNGLLNMYDFIPEKNIKKKSGKILDIISTQCAYICNVYNGNFYSATTRLYIRKLNKNYYNTNNFNNFTKKICGLKYNKEDYPGRALSTTQYKFPLTVLEIIKLRKQKDIITEFNSNLTKEKIKINKLKKYPVWIKWSYGKYISPTNILQTIYFISKNNVYLQPTFKQLTFLKNTFYRFTIYISILLLYPLISLLIYKFASFSSILGLGIQVKSLINNSDCFVVTTLIDNVKPSTLGAQQQYWMITTNNGIITSTFGKHSDTTKQLTGNSIQPSIEHDENSMIVTYKPNITAKGISSYSDEINLIIDGLNYTKNEHEDIYEYIINTLGFVINIKHIKNKLIISWKKNIYLL